jgi:hypothetical protein
MNRKFAGAVVTTITIIAMPVLAADQQPMMQESSTRSVAEAAGALLPVVAPQSVIPAKGDEMNGTVMISTPDELVVHTAKGLQTFEVTPQTQMVAGPTEGEDVTIVFKPARGSVSGTAVGSAAESAPTSTRVADLALTVMPREAAATSR